ncbi:MAG: OsmC family protein [Gemmatimonadota bacterium]
MDKRTASVRWVGRDLVFEGRTATSAPILLDSGSKEGPSPTEALLMSLAACMAIDVKVILEKGRVAVDEIEVGLEGDRAPEPPRRFTFVRMEIRVKGPVEEDRGKLERAAQLSRDKYCSVFHSLRPDLDVEITTTIL